MAQLTTRYINSSSSAWTTNLYPLYGIGNKPLHSTYFFDNILAKKYHHKGGTFLLLLYISLYTINYTKLNTILNSQNLYKLSISEKFSNKKSKNNFSNILSYRFLVTTIIEYS